ncbi:MAG: hypothetical protein JXB48_09715 [Candidatus Latescibacteria bacterium]|nr:hypothetical protein [Candidatus Latescibacterota bacterium]
MKTLFVLFINDYKRIRVALLFLLILYLITILFLKFGNRQLMMNSIPGFFVVFMTFGTTLAAPAIFGLLLNDDLKYNTVYLLFSLPKKRFMIFFGKYFLAITICLVTSIGSSMCMKLFQEMEYHNDILVDYSQLVILTSMYVFWILGITCFTAAIMLSIKRYRQVAGLVLFVTLMVLSYKFHDMVEWMIKYKIDFLRWNIRYDEYRVMFLIGLFFVVLGHYIYNKFSEI